MGSKNCAFTSFTFLHLKRIDDELLLCGRTHCTNALFRTFRQTQSAKGW